MNQNRNESECIAQMESVAKALIKIRDQKLYRDEFATFEDYVRARFGAEVLNILATWEQAVRERQ